MIVERLWQFYLEAPGLTLLIVGNVLFVGGACALAIGALALRRRNDRKAEHWGDLERRWEAKTIEVITERTPPSAVWATVRRREQLHFVGFLLRFARRLTGAERARVDQLASPFLEWVLPQLRARAPERRARAIQTLTTLSSRRYAREVLQALDDPSPLVAMVAARSLARRENPEYAEAILARLHRFGQWRPSFLASMLASIGPAVIPTLRGALANRQLEPAARTVAAAALQEMNDYGAADVAADVLLDATDKNLLIATLSLLAHVGRSDQVDTIRRHQMTRDPVVRSRVMSALGRIGAEQDVETLVAGLDDPSPWVALRAAEALYEMDDRALGEVATSDHPRAALARQMLAGGVA